MKELMFQKELMLIRQIDQKKFKLCHYWYFSNENFSYNPYLCDGCYNIMQKSNDSKNIATVRIKKCVYRIYFLVMSKHKAKKLMINFTLIDKMGKFYEWY